MINFVWKEDMTPLRDEEVRDWVKAIFETPNILEIDSKHYFCQQVVELGIRAYAKTNRINNKLIRFIVDDYNYYLLEDMSFVDYPEKCSIFDDLLTEIF